MPSKRSRKECVDPGMENFVAFLTTPFVIAGTVILIIWFGLNGYLNPTSWPTWLLGGVSIAILSAIQIPLYRTLLLGSVQRRKRQAKNTHCAISGPGCVAGLFTYGVAILVCALLFWQGGLEGLVIGVVLTPFCCLGVATLITFIGG